MRSAYLLMAIVLILIPGCCSLTGAEGWQDANNDGVNDVYASNSSFAVVADAANPENSLVNFTDSNNDGRVDTVAMDTDKDGKADVFLFDRNYDGKVDKWHVATWNGTANSYAWDLTGDAIPDAYDSDGDGAIDAWDVNSDGVIDRRDPDNDGDVELDDKDFNGVFDEMEAMGKPG